MKKNITRLPPHSEESEQGIIGCCLTTPMQSIPETQIVLRSTEYFYDLRHQTIWESIAALELREVDMISVVSHLKKRGVLDDVGGISYLNTCQDSVPSTANLPVYLKEVEEKHVLRRAIHACADITSRCYDHTGELPEFLDGMERDILGLRPNQQQASSIKSLVHDAINRLEERVASGGKILGHATGLHDLDRLTDGVHGGEMIVVAGYTSTGKTALSVGIATTNALQGIPVAIFTAEMLPVQLVIRQLCSTAGANSKRLVESDVTGLTVAAGRIAKAPIHIEPANGMTAGQVIATARRLKQKHGIKIIVVDYLQLLSGVGDNREQQIASISKVMKAMALELDCAVFALSQLTDDGKLRESRSIGHDADSIWKLENNGEWKPDIQPIKLRVDKCRDGETGLVELVFNKQFTRFESASKVSDNDVPNYENR